MAATMAEGDRKRRNNRNNRNNKDCGVGVDTVMKDFPVWFRGATFSIAVRAI